MKFPRVETLAACKQALSGMHEIHERRIREYNAAIERAKDEWREQHTHEWRAYLEEMMRRLDDGEIITSEMLRERSPYSFENDGVRTPRVYRNPKAQDIGFSGVPVPIERYTEPRDLQIMITVLETVLDDEVSTSALEKIGAGSSVTREAMRALTAYRIEKTKQERETNNSKENSNG